MTNEAVFGQRMTMPIDHVHVSNSHGDIIEIYFRCGWKMYIWAFKNPHDLQAILVDRQYDILDDFRDPDCKAHSDEYVKRVPMEGRKFIVSTS